MGGSFSFDTPEEVMHVLASIRSSAADAATKNDLRSLVLSYTNGGKDPALQVQLTQRLAQAGVTPTATPTKLAVGEAHAFGSSRGVPSFTSSAPQSAPAPPAVEPVSPPTPAITTSAAPAPQTPAPAAVVQTPPTAPAAPTPVTPPPAATPPVPTAEPVATVTPEPATNDVTSAPAQTTESVAAPATPTDDPLRRIREIKALVNEQIGNPVNLVDIDNAVGREYMAALLDAMKKVNGGGNISDAMQRLETAYTAVERVIEARGVQPSSAPESATAAPVAAQSTPAPPTSTPDTTATEPADTQSIPIITQVPDGQRPQPVSMRNTMSSAPEKITSSATDDSAARWANTSIRMTDTVAATQKTTPPPAPQKPAAEPAVTPVAPPPAPETADAPASAAGVKPISQTGDPLKSVSDLPTADSLATAENGDPLFTKEVDDGLDQLLSDWVLFRKSGLFGTGAKGREHPLFLKIKDLEIPILLAGRFEGATQEIKQSITDYMNGWRYEQGIIYEKGETFEHYLRRVIRHILDLQK